MNELITDIKSLELETLKNLRNSKAANTLRAYQADFKDFSAFCTKNGLSSMPTEPKILSIYLTHLSSTSKFISPECTYLASSGSTISDKSLPSLVISCRICAATVTGPSYTPVLNS